MEWYPFNNNTPAQDIQINATGHSYILYKVVISGYLFILCLIITNDHWNDLLRILIGEFGRTTGMFSAK